MTELYLKILNISIAASWLVLAVLVLRFILKKAPRSFHVLLWGIVGLRLLFPFSVESAWSLIPSAETIPAGIEMAAAPAIDSGIHAINRIVNPILLHSCTPGVGASVNPLQITVFVCACVWLLGVAAMLICTAVSYHRLRSKIETAVLFRDNIFRSENVSTPFVLGILRPRIFLPFRMGENDLEHVVAHEQAHISRRDHWWKPLGFLLLTIHWFNPLLWLGYVLLCRDIELACDEKVIRDLGNEQRADYSQALLTCSAGRHAIAACPLAFGEVGVKKRIQSVMNYKKPALWLTIVSVIVCIVTAVCFLTSPQTEKPAGDAAAELAQYRTEYIGDAPSVAAIAQGLPYPAGYSYGFIELQTEEEPYELIVFLHGEENIPGSDFSSCAEIAFRLIGNMGVISFRDSESNELISSFQRETGTKYYLTIGAEGVTHIGVSLPGVSGGCQRADVSPFQKGEQIYLELLDDLSDLSGLEVTAANAEGKILWLASIPNGEADMNITYFTQDGWSITSSQ